MKKLLVLATLCTLGAPATLRAHCHVAISECPVTLADQLKKNLWTGAASLWETNGDVIIGSGPIVVGQNNVASALSNFFEGAQTITATAIEGWPDGKTPRGWPEGRGDVTFVSWTLKVKKQGDWQTHLCTAVAQKKFIPKDHRKIKPSEAVQWQFLSVRILPLPPVRR